MDNHVELIGHYGNDHTHALSAWTSTARDLTPEKEGRMDKLLNMLAREGHHTPFEKSSLHFLVRTDIATHIHLLKHRVGVSLNAESARYKEFRDDEYYTPVDWDDEEIARYQLFMEREALPRYHDCLRRLTEKGVEKGLSKREARKRAKESARFYIPYGKQITSDVMFNFRSFMHFIKLRYSIHAQLEVREVARKMLELVRSTGSFPLTMEAFELFGEAGHHVLREPYA